MLVTGAAGFIGSHLTEALLARGERVLGVDCLDAFYDPAIKARNLAVIRSHARGDAFRFEQADIRDADRIRALYAEHAPRATIHLAARAGVRPSIADPGLYADVNVTGTTTLLSAACGADAKAPFVMASSSSVYGNNRKVPFSETDPVDEPISPYAATKKACELTAHTFHALHGTPIAALRLFTVFGPRQRPDLAIAKFIRKVDGGEAIPMFGDGSMERDFTYVGDVVMGILAALDRIGGFGFRVWNIGSDHPVRLDAMIATIGEVMGREPVIERQPEQPGDVKRTYADLTRSRSELGYEPRVAFAEGIARQWEAVRERPSVHAVVGSAIVAGRRI